jgi:uncharacterized membrane protein
MKWKNSTAAPNTAKRRFVTVCKHLLIWSIWYGLNSLVMVGYSQPLTPLLWVHMFYNGISLILVFYGTAHCIQPWFYAQTKQQFDPFTISTAYRQWLGTRWWAVLAILTGYVALSVFIDRTFPIYESSTLFVHVDKRLNRVLPYIAAAIMYGHYRSLVQWYRALLAEARAQTDAMWQQRAEYNSFAERLFTGNGANSTDTLHLPIRWTKNIAVPTIAKSPLITVALHSMLWVIWFGLHSLSVVVFSQTFTVLDWLLVFADYGALMLVFYGITFCMKKYFFHYKWSLQEEPTTRQQLRRLIRIELFVALAILTAYIAISVYLSQRFPVDEFPVSWFEYSWQHFNYSLPYVMIAILFSYFSIGAQWYQVWLHGANVVGQQLERHNKALFALNNDLQRLCR